MLVLKDILKYYEIAGTKYWALKGVNLSFRKSEFVAILGESGSGKTTLLNIIGGLDRYTEGDLIIDNVSTKEFTDRNWDAYRNHRVGFVFQSYNLIPHLSALDNVELALTLSGISKEERTARAKEVLGIVGLDGHMTKKPNQLSGGQQQRVAIARALVNNPNIILADEPTGALDSETSTEIMELLQSIAGDKLIIMVTHNADIANKYAKRIINLKDGQITHDSDPYTVTTTEVTHDTQKSSMSFFTAMKLSFKNLLTKKVRTIITAIAGSIGIIGVGLVLSLQYGFTSFLNEMERGTFAGLPMQISRNFIDMTSMLDPDSFVPGESVDTGFIGRDPNLTLMGENIIDQEFIDFIMQNGITDYADVVKMYGMQINAYNMVNGQLFAPPATPTIMDAIIPGMTNPIINESQYSPNFLEDFAAVLAQYEGEYQFGATIVLSRNNTVPNALLEFLGLQPSTPYDYEDALGLTFRIILNDGRFNSQMVPGMFVPNPDSMLALAWPNMPAEHFIEVTITRIIQSSTNFVTLSSGILLDHDTSDAIHTANFNSQIATAQRASDTFVVPGLDAADIEIDQFLTMIGGHEWPGTIYIYPNSFDDRAMIHEIILNYNASQTDEARHITMLDNTAIALSMVNTIMNSVSGVLIAFASISLVVSSIMIGIITYTSVLERTKEIGVLRSIGARKRDISNVFSAEAILIGFTAGVIGVLLTFAIVPAINFFLRNATDGARVAELSWFYALFLVGISVLLTFIAGLFPSRIAANKHPVDALRSGT